MIMVSNDGSVNITGSLFPDTKSGGALSHYTMTLISKLLYGIVESTGIYVLYLGFISVVFHKPLTHKRGDTLIMIIFFYCF